MCGILDHRHCAVSPGSEPILTSFTAVTHNNAARELIGIIVSLSSPMMKVCVAVYGLCSFFIVVISRIFHTVRESRPSDR